MSKDLNQCNFIGRLGQAPEIKYLPSGSAVANISIACGDDYKDKQGKKVERTNWINCVAFGKLAEIMGEYLQKGSKIYVSGKQSTRKWQDNSGADKYTTEITLSEMIMLDSKGENQQGQRPPQQSQQAAQPNSVAPDEFLDDIPF